MKKVILSLIFVFTLMGCNKSESDSLTTTGFKIQPDSLEKFSKPSEPPISYNINFGDTNNTVEKTGDFAIIYAGVVNDKNYVGIAVSDNPTSDNFNLKIYFEVNQENVIPVSKALTPGTTDVIKVTTDNTYIYTYESGDLSLSFIDTDIEIDGNTYTIYTITSSGTANLSDSKELKDINITALEVGN